MSEPDRPLAGRRILLARPAGRGDALARRLRRLGAIVSERPTIALVAPRDPAPARRAVEALDDYDWIVFTSATGVAFFLDVRDAAHGDPARPRGSIAAIGPGTARALREGALEPSVVARDSRAEGLAEVLGPRIAASHRVLLVKPEEARAVLAETLRSRGAAVEGVAFYRNVPAPGIAQIARDVAKQAYDVVVFTSPSTFEKLWAAQDAAGPSLAEALHRVRLVAIGPVTAQALERAGVPAAAVAAEPSVEGIVNAVLRAAAR